MLDGAHLLDAMGVPRDAFVGRVALVTGGARGIGAETARLLSERGATVAVLDVLTESAHGEGPQDSSVHFFCCDVGAPEELAATIARVEAAYGPVDLFVHSAVHVELGVLGELSLEGFGRSHDVNVKAPFVALQALVPGMVRRGFGVAVNLAALERAPFGAALNPSKAAARTLFFSVARDLDPESGVSLFSFLPGVVDTPGLHRNIVAGLARCMGISEARALELIVHNPGYDGLLPATYAAAALVFAMHHAREYHGQMVDPFEPLSRFGLLASARSEGGARDGRVEWVRTFEEVHAHNRDLEERIRVRTEQLAEAHRRSEGLLLNILPQPIAERLKVNHETIADAFDDVSVVFADLVGFTPLAAKLPPTAIVRLLDEVFSRFDAISDRHGLEKIKTIGDCYMVVGGLPEPRADHLAQAARAALAFVSAVEEVGQRVGVPLACRVGIHMGPVVAGVIGTRKFSYDLWGDTVNLASRMESHGSPGRVHCTEAVRAHLSGHFDFEGRGEVDVKGRGRVHTFFLEGEKTAVRTATPESDAS